MYHVIFEIKHLANYEYNTKLTHIETKYVILKSQSRNGLANSDVATSWNA